MALPDLSLSAGQVSGTSRRDIPKCERTQRMVALTRDFHVVTPCIATRLSAVFVSISYIAKAWYMRALFHFSIRHFNSILSSMPAFSEHKALCTLDVAPFSPLIEAA
jgi:hypothetical protein